MTPFEKKSLIIHCSGSGAGDEAAIRRVYRCDKNGVRGQLLKEAGHMEGGSICCAYKGNVCIYGC